MNPVILNIPTDMVKPDVKFFPACTLKLPNGATFKVVKTNLTPNFLEIKVSYVGSTRARFVIQADSAVMSDSALRLWCYRLDEGDVGEVPFEETLRLDLRGRQFTHLRMIKILKKEGEFDKTIETITQEPVSSSSLVASRHFSWDDSYHWYY
jgi:hypothetical protein